MNQPTTAASLDAMFDMLANSYRRRILLAVADHNPREEDEFTPETFSRDGADGEAIEQLNTELFHTHPPKLAEAGYIEWSPEAGTIRRWPNFETIAPLHKLMVEHEDELPADWP